MMILKKDKNGQVKTFESRIVSIPQISYEIR